MTAAITDFEQFTALRAGANQRDPAVLEEVAGQFEALFIETLMKNMRSASLGEPIFGKSDQHEMYQEMLDKQFALEMAGGKGIGLKDLLIRQLGGRPSQAIAGITTESMTRNDAEDTPMWSKPADFIRDIWPHAERAAKKLNVAPEGLVAQAALETGWGKHVMRQADGTPSHNLFGIKANSSWTGPTAVKPTLEYRGGVATHEMAKFRSYPDIGAMFQDYVDVVGGQPRFEDVRNHGDDVAAFANALQKSGYATDPDYASKINGVLTGQTMQDALSALKDDGDVPISAHRATGEVT